MPNETDLCSRCRFYDWGIPMKGSVGVNHECFHPTGGFKPGFTVETCDGFDLIKEETPE